MAKELVNVYLVFQKNNYVESGTKTGMGIIA